MLIPSLSYFKNGHHASTGFTNHTIKPLLELCRPEAYVVILGNSALLSPVLFDCDIVIEIPESAFFRGWKSRAFPLNWRPAPAIHSYSSAAAIVFIPI
jgi:hypothetical protein